MIEFLNLRRIFTIILIGVFAALAAFVRINVFQGGFIVALSVVLLAVFIYSFEDIKPIQIAISAGIISPLVRGIYLYAQGNPFVEVLTKAGPDCIFFFTYGIIFTYLYRLPVIKEKNIKNFPVIIMICEFISNIVEILSRSMIGNDNLMTSKVILGLAVIAIIRTGIVQMIIISMEVYGSLLVDQENEITYKKLMVLASSFESELYIMNKNVAEIEDVMRKSYLVYKELEKHKIPRDITEMALDVSKDAHEIKGDYERTINKFQESFVKELKTSNITIKEIIQILKQDITSQLADKRIQCNYYVKANFPITNHFEMMSILRNLVINGIEAIGDQKGSISVKVERQEENFRISVKDTGPGLTEKEISNIFTHGYSTKFNEETGNVQRGIGLFIVKDYVQKFFNGEMKVNSVKGEYTEFLIEIPIKEIEGIECDTI
ncbi:MAG: sensor histidine kinase [Anaerovoracaceae bacterium]